MATAFFFGAGCSFGTLCAHDVFPPLARCFGKALVKRTPRPPTPMLEMVAHHLGTTLAEVGLEQLWTCIDFHAKFPDAFPITWNNDGGAARELKGALLTLYGPSCDKVADALELTDDYTLGKIVREIRPGDTVISFNYDTLVERLFQKPRDARLRHCCGPPSPGVVRFAKPHGSASWDRLRLCHNLADCSPDLVSLRVADANRGSVDPLLLGAVPIKSELIKEVQRGCPEVYSVIFSQWRVVAEAVETAERLVVLGYSFPPEDTYGRFFFQEAARKRTSAPLEIEFYDLPSQKEQVRRSIYESFGEVKSVAFKGKVTPARRPTPAPD